jgi:hypothetical protein
LSTSTDLSLFENTLAGIILACRADEAQDWKAIWQPQESDEPYVDAEGEVHHPQIELLASDCPEIFYGGARGGGKTDGVLGKWMQHHERWRGAARGVFFRRRQIHLEDTILRSGELYTQTGGRYVGSPSQKWVWLDGAELRFRHLWDIKAAQNYQGHAYTFIAFEEAQQWPDPEPLNLLRGTLRSAEGVLCQIVLTGNPGGPGHHWVRARYVDPAPMGYEEIDDPTTGDARMFIPAKLEDNPALRENDPTYERRLLAVSNNPALVKAWRFGAWDIIAGAFFSDVWVPERQVLERFEVPKGWHLVRSFDWGSAKPSSLGLWAISDGNPLPENGGPYAKRVFPKGSFIRIGELYTCERDPNGFIQPNRGQRFPPKKLGELVERETDKYRRSQDWRGYADPSIFDETGGKSIYRQMIEGTKLGWLGLLPGDNKRAPGWQRMREMLAESAAEHPEGPGIWVMKHCTEWIRTVPSLPIDDKNPDDVDTDAEDHPGDETRYAVNSYKGGSSQELRY